MKYEFDPEYFAEESLYDALGTAGVIAVGSMQPMPRWKGALEDSVQPGSSGFIIRINGTKGHLEIGPNSSSRVSEYLRAQDVGGHWFPNVQNITEWAEDHDIAPYALARSLEVKGLPGKGFFRAGYAAMVAALPEIAEAYGVTFLNTALLGFDQNEA